MGPGDHWEETEWLDLGCICSRTWRTYLGTGREVRHEATERERDAGTWHGVCSDWDPGWTLEVRSVSCSASLAWPEMRVDVEWGDGGTWSGPQQGSKVHFKERRYPFT